LERRPTSAIIDTEALRFNYRQLRKVISGTTKVMAIVKANAYGHGDVEVASVLEAMGCEFFGVAIAEEGLKLRQGGIKNPIVVLGGAYPNQIKDVIGLGLTPVVFDLDTARLINEEAKKSGSPQKIHVKIDTGMGRLGLLPDQVEPFFARLRELKGLRVEAVLSHFVESESEDKEYSKHQLGLFLRTVETIKALGVSPVYIDMANSAAAVDYAASRLDLIRPGIMLYGSSPSARFREKIELKPVMQLKTRVLHVKSVGPGFSVSYGRTFVTTRPSVIATLPIGYGDGLPRRLSGAGEALVNGRRAPLIGRVCMDLTMCDVTDIPNVGPGTEVVLIGRQGDSEITADEVAAKTNTISYEIFCNISSRVPRIYV
jgi:alanine racemase